MGKIVKGTDVTQEDIKKFRNYVYLVGREGKVDTDSKFHLNMSNDDTVIDALIGTYNKMPEEFKSESISDSVLKFIMEKKEKEDRQLFLREAIKKTMDNDVVLNFICKLVYEVLPDTYKVNNVKEDVLEYLREIRASVIDPTKEENIAIQDYDIKTVSAFAKAVYGRVDVCKIVMSRFELGVPLDCKGSNIIETLNNLIDPQWRDKEEQRLAELNEGSNISFEDIEAVKDHAIKHIVECAKKDKESVASEDMVAWMKALLQGYPNMGPTIVNEIYELIPPALRDDSKTKEENITNYLEITK